MIQDYSTLCISQPWAAWLLCLLNKVPKGVRNILLFSLLAGISAPKVQAQFYNNSTIANNGGLVSDFSSQWFNNTGAVYNGSNNGTFGHYGPSVQTFINNGIFNCTTGHTDIFYGPAGAAGSQEIGGTIRPDFFNLQFSNGDSAIHITNTNGANVRNSATFANGITTTVRANHSSGALRFEDNATYTGANSDTQHVNGYVSKTGNDIFVFPVGSGTDLRTLAIAAPADTVEISVAWFAGNPATVVDPSEGVAHGTTAVASPLTVVSPAGFWDWVPVAGNDDGITVTVSIPDLSTFAVAADLRLAGWNGAQWIDLSGAANADGNTEGSTLSGTIPAGSNIQAIAIGSVANNPAFACTAATGYLTQGVPTGAYIVNISTGDTSLAKTNLMGTAANTEINGIGFNVKDNYIWGSRQLTNQVVRIHGDWSIDTFAVSGLPVGNLYVGDVNEDGVLYLFNAEATNTRIQRVDVNPASPTYLQMLSPLPTSPSNIYDWAFSPIDGNLYALSSSDYQLFRFDAATGTRTTLGIVTGEGIQVDNGANPFGAAYMDNDGNLYVSNNATGKIYKIATPHTGNVSAVFVTDGPPSASNDGARCPLSPVPMPPIAVNDTAVTDSGKVVIIDVQANDSTRATAAPLDSTSTTVVLPPANGSATVDPATGTITYTPAPGFTGSDSLRYVVTDTLGTPDTAKVYITVVPAQPVFNCTSATGYLVQNNPADAFIVDISTGITTLVKDNLLSGANATLNGMGYNLTDNHLWAARNGTNQIVRIGSDWSVQTFAISGLPTDRTFNIGDISNEGIMYLYASSPATTTIYRVDVNPASPNYLKALPPLTTAATQVSDWSFSPVDGNLYGMDDFNWQLYRFNPATGARTVLGVVAGGGIQTSTGFGASYIDAAGNLYVGNNTTGSIYKIASPHTGNLVATFMSQGPATTGNDGARCPLAGLPPIAVNDTATTDAGKPVIIPVLTNDSTVTGGAPLDSSSVTITAQPQHGAVTVDPATGGLTYTPAPNYTGRDTLYYLVRDTAGIPDTAAVFITIVPAQPVFVCTSSTGYLFQNNPTDVFIVNLSTGASGMAKDNVLGDTNAAMNAAGYNAKDNLLWAVHNGTNELVRMGSDWSAQRFPIAGLPASNSSNVGDIGTNGIMYMYQTNTTTIYRVDLDPASPSYLRLLSPLTTTESAIADWAISPVDHNIYGVDNSLQLLRFNPNTGVRTVVGNVSGGGIGSATGFGACYMDVDGALYLSDNATGNIFRVANPHTGGLTATLLAKGPASGSNDGARCALTLVNEAPVAVNDTAATTVNTPVSIPVLANDTAKANPLDSASVAVIDQPQNGTVTIDSSGNIIYTPDSSFTGTDTLQYIVRDTAGMPSDTAQVIITINPPPGDHDNDGVPDINDPDDDNDGIPDTTEAGTDPNNPKDTDKDGVPDIHDLDSDNDGITDIIEGGGTDPDGNGMGDTTDVDNDGLPDEFDPDQGGTAQPTPDTDGDGTPDYLDIDADNDGIVDNIESQPTTAYIPPTGTDTDGDGIDNAYDPTNGPGGPGVTPVNTDTLDKPDYLDTDTDNDGKPDILEGWDTNGNGTIDSTEKQAGTADVDNDGLLDGFDADTTVINPTNGTTPASYPDMNTPGNDRDWREPVANPDHDNDGVPDINDPDDDNDGIPDTTEVGTDPNNPKDTDGDGIPDHHDLDSDNDGIPDIIEAGGNDPDNDGVAHTTDADNDGLPDEFDPDQGGTVQPTPDTDGDGVPDLRDIDTDNDGIPDVKEAGLPDTDNNGIVDGPDTDGNGWSDPVDDMPALTLPNSDGDTRPDYLDIDADNDGIVDNIEGQPTSTYKAPAGTDSDGDGLDNAYDPVNGFGGPGVTPVNTAGADTPDYTDPDADDDGKPDTLEGWDTNGNGVIDGAEKRPGTADADNDGLPDGYDADPARINPTNGTTPASYPDINAPGNDRDWREPTAGPDNDVDGITDATDVDDDNDGVPDTTEIGPDPNNPADTDNDGIPDYKDLDSDNDGIPDIIENGGTDTNGDGLVDNPADQDKNGLPDAYDPAQGGTPLTPPDRDNDGVPDAQDLDSDNDGIPDVVETGGTDADNDGKPDEPFTDADKDGFNDAIDPQNNTPTGGTPLVITGPDNNADGKPDTYPGGDDHDRDGVPNLWDIDSDNDGITDVKEAGLPDTDNNGQADGPDADGNGWKDPVDNLPALTPPNSDGTGNPDYLDLDADNDGIVDNIEGQGTTAYIPPTGIDTDGDGLDNAYDPTNGPSGAGITPVNTDNSDRPDYTDTDTDNDGKPDSLEGWDTNGNGVIDGAEKQAGTADADNDGLLDGYDANPARPDPTNGTTPGSYPDVNNPGNDRDWREKQGPVTDLEVTIALQTTTAIRTGDFITYTVTVVNKGPQNATGVVVSNILPVMLNAPREILVPKGTASYDPVTHSIVWNMDGLLLNETQMMTFTTRVLSNGNLTDSAVVRGNETDPVMVNNEDVAPAVTITGEELFIPNTFTPNSDGRNDRFVIKGLARYTNVRLEIYNRWGNQVYRSDNYSNDWDGAGLSQGIYYYVLKVRDAAGAEKEYQGWLQLLR